MTRTLYMLLVIGLIGGSAWSAAGDTSQRQKLGAGMGVIIIAALQR